MLKTILIAISVIATSSSVHGDSSKIDPQLNSALQDGGTVNVVIAFKDGIESTLKSMTIAPLQADAINRGQRIQEIVTALEKNADSSQAGVLQLLSRRSSEGNDFKYFKRYPTSNLIYIKEASPAIINAITNDPQVSRVWEEPIIELIGAVPDRQPEEVDDETPQGAEGYQPPYCEKYLENGTSPTMHSIHLLEAWEELGGNKGEGILVGSIDGGARSTHSLLRDSFVGNDYGWYDPLDKKLEAFEDEKDRQGHGTMTMGLMVAKNGLGMAPDAKWMTCRACNKSGCPYEALRDCIKFIECPTLPDGSNPDCSKAPRVINNSWVSKRGTDVFNEDIMRWREMGIIPVFAIGNRGDRCNTTTAPGEMPFVIGVGGVHSDGELYGFSSIGPAPDGRIKPDLVAPGVYTYTTGNRNDDYCAPPVGGGTSFASPHVAGLIALLLVRNPNLTFEEAYDLLTKNADQEELWITYFPSTCNETSSTEFPNNIFGFGRINALKTLQAQSAILKAQQK